MPIESLRSLDGLGSLGRISGVATAAGEPATPGSPFATMLHHLLDGHRQAHAAAESAVTQLASGDAQDVHSVALAVAQADLSFRLILEMRNRLTEAYQEVMRMQI